MPSCCEIQVCVDDKPTQSLGMKSNKKIFSTLNELQNSLRSSDSCHGFLVEETLVVIVNCVEFILENMFLGDLADDLVHGGVGHVDSHGLQHERVGSTELETSKLPGGDLPQQNRPGNIIN